MCVCVCVCVCVVLLFTYLKNKRKQTEIFQAPVPPDIMTHYREYIFFPMDLGTIKEVEDVFFSFFLSPL